MYFFEMKIKSPKTQFILQFWRYHCQSLLGGPLRKSAGCAGAAFSKLRLIVATLCVCLYKTITARYNRKYKRRRSVRSQQVFDERFAECMWSFCISHQSTARRNVSLFAGPHRQRVVFGVKFKRQIPGIVQRRPNRQAVEHEGLRHWQQIVPYQRRIRPRETDQVQSW